MSIFNKLNLFQRQTFLITSNYSFIGGGVSNCICTSTCAAIIGGTGNTVLATTDKGNGAVIGGSGITSVSANMLHSNRLYLKDLPTADPGDPGVVWNDSGTLKIST